jgi:hypothetical protein
VAVLRRGRRHAWRGAGRRRLPNKGSARRCTVRACVPARRGCSGGCGGCLCLLRCQRVRQDSTRAALAALTCHVCGCSCTSHSGGTSVPSRISQGSWLCVARRVRVCGRRWRAGKRNGRSVGLRGTSTRQGAPHAAPRTATYHSKPSTPAQQASKQASMRAHTRTRRSRSGACTHARRGTFLSCTCAGAGTPQSCRARACTPRRAGTRPSAWWLTAGRKQQDRQGSMRACVCWASASSAQPHAAPLTAAGLRRTQPAAAVHRSTPPAHRTICMSGQSFALYLCTSRQRRRARSPGWL